MTIGTGIITNLKLGNLIGCLKNQVGKSKLAKSGQALSTKSDSVQFCVILHRAIILFMPNANKNEFRFYVVIPAHNESEFIGQTLQSLIDQNFQPQKIVVVNDNSSDRTPEIASGFCEKHDFISLVNTDSSRDHLPGGKVVKAFYKGFESLDDNYDVICKFDGDLIFPPNYFEVLNTAFSENPELGIAGGFCHIEKNGQWQLENLTGKDHLRGALKAYRKACFEDIGQLKTAMGWDTVDELLARYHGWTLQTFEGLIVRHLRPTGQTYQERSKYKQGEAFYSLRYGFWITIIASAKSAWLKKDFKILQNDLRGFYLAKKQKINFLVTAEEGRWIRNYRWKKIREKLF